MEFQIKDSKGQKLNYVNEDPYKVAIKAHEWVEFNYDSDEIRENYISNIIHDKTADQLLPDELKLLIVYSAIDNVEDDSLEHDLFAYQYEKIFYDFLNTYINKSVDYCTFLDLYGYIDFKVIND